MVPRLTATLDLQLLDWNHGRTSSLNLDLPSERLRDLTLAIQPMTSSHVRGMPLRTGCMYFHFDTFTGSIAEECLRSRITRGLEVLGRSSTLKPVKLQGPLRGLLGRAPYFTG